MPVSTVPLPVSIPAADGYVLQGAVWRGAQGVAASPVVIINCATSVLCRYYARFAQALQQRGGDVITYDYRGIGGSRHGSLRQLAAGWLDWGEQDFEGVLRYAMTHFPGQPIYVVGHSVGGFLIGMAPSAHRVSRIFTMGAQYAYWRDYAPDARMGMRWRWHVLMPLLARLLGVTPAHNDGDIAPLLPALR